MTAAQTSPQPTGRPGPGRGVGVMADERAIAVVLSGWSSPDGALIISPELAKSLAAAIAAIPTDAGAGGVRETGQWDAAEPAGPPPGSGPAIPGDDAARVAAVAEAMYESLEWSGCAGSQWSRVPQLVRDRWIVSATHVAAAIAATPRDDAARALDDLAARLEALADEADAGGDHPTAERIRAAIEPKETP